MGPTRITHDVRSRMRLGVLCCAVVCSVACSDGIESAPDGPQIIPTVGGQSGQEGSCAIDPVPALRFDPAAIARTVVGRHGTQLRWNSRGNGVGTTQPASGVQRALFDISARGEVQTKLACGGSAFLDVDVNMQLPESGLNVTFEAVAQAWGAGDQIMISTTLDRRFKSTLEKHAKDLAAAWTNDVALQDPEKYYFDLWMFRGGLSGQMSAQHDNAFCRLAVWPETYCDSGYVPLERKRALGDFDIEQALEAVRELGEQTLTWTDGRTTSVHFDVELESGQTCAGPHFLRSTGEDNRDGTDVGVPARVRATTADGALDAGLPGSLFVTLSDAGAWDGRLRFEADVSGSRAAFDAANITLPLKDDAGRQINLHVEVSRQSPVDRGLVSITSLDLGSGSTPSDTLQQPRDDVFVCSGGPQATEVHESLQGGFGW